MTRYNLISPRERKDKTYWANVGTAFTRDKGGFSLIFDALPLPDKKGNVHVLMVEHEDKGRDSAPRQSVVLDDEIPF